MNTADPRFKFSATLIGLLAACATSGADRTRADRYDRMQLRDNLRSGQSGLVLGEFTLTGDAIVDGDTVKVSGLDTSLRLLSIDTEETFKNEQSWREYGGDFAAYWALKQGARERPVKIPTPVGMLGKKFAEKFFNGARTVRLERDHPKEIRGRYNRHLAYVFVKKKQGWVNYNVEAVRAGMSPYFTKYGYSRRFHEQFVAAQREAKQAGRGIWDPTLEHYPDYPRRLKWWNDRADYLQSFERRAENRDDHIILTRWDAPQRLTKSLGEEVTVMAAVGDIYPSRGAGPTRVLLSRRQFADFPLIFFSTRVLEQSRIASSKGEFVQVRGKVTSYTPRRGKNRDKPQLQIEIQRPDQVVLSNIQPPPKTLPPPNQPTAPALRQP